MEANDGPTIPQSFIWRRLHSLVGVFLVLFLIEHLLTNSQAALLVGQDGIGFINMVNLIHSLPYLPAIEVGLLGVPILIHTIWGIMYLRSAKPNSMGGDGSNVHLKYGRNKAYTWQRITSYLLVLGIFAHVGHMRFYNYPTDAHASTKAHQYFVRVSMDDGLYTLAPRLGVKLVDQKLIEQAEQRVAAMEKVNLSIDAGDGESSTEFNPLRAKKLTQLQQMEQQKEWLEAAKARELGEGQVLAASGDFGTAILLVVRDTFKSPLKMILYSIFVIAACFHACNGLWTALITWGVTLTPRSQNLALKATYGLMAALILLGMSAIWGTYWINLRA